MRTTLAERLEQYAKAVRLASPPPSDRRGSRTRRSPQRPLVEGLETRQLLTISIHQYSLDRDVIRAQPTAIASGPDGDLWVVDEGNPDRILHVGTEGAFDPARDAFPLPPGSQGPTDLILGPDGNLWFGTQDPGNYIAKMSPSGQVSQIVVGPPGSNPRGLVVGPDGNIWFALPGNGSPNSAGIGRVRLDPTRGTPLDVEIFPLPAGAEGPNALSVGPDGKIYYTLGISRQVGVIEPTATGSFGASSTAPASNAIVPGLTMSGTPSELVVGSDGKLWFTIPGNHALGRWDSKTGTLLPEINLPADSIPRGLVAGPDNNVYVGLFGTGQVLRVTPEGIISKFSVPAGSWTNDFTVGSNGDIYITNQTGRPLQGQLVRLDLPAGIEAQPVNLVGAEGQPVQGVVGSFFDPSTPDPNLVPNVLRNYEVSIDWGDGTPPTPFSSEGLEINGSNFMVRGTHTYAHDGNYALSLTVRDAYIGTMPDGSPVPNNTTPGAAPGDGGRKVTVTGTVFVRNTPPNLNGLVVSGLAGTPILKAAVFSFIDPSGSAEGYKATIDWGDGTGTTLGSVVADGAGKFRVTGNHSFAAPGSYLGTVTLEDASGVVRSGPFSSNISPLNVTGTERFGAIVNVPLTDVVLARLSGPFSPDASYYQAIINWGDGTPSEPGLIIATPNGFQVQGNHTFTTSSRSRPGGVFRGKITVGTPTAPTLLTVDRTFTVTGGQAQTGGTPEGALSIESDCGPSNRDFITNMMTPTFTGSADPGETVRLFLQSPGGQPVQAGVTTADANGRWSITTDRLTDGVYNVSFRTFDASGAQTGSGAIVSPESGGPLVIDTLGPKITGLTFNPRKGQFQVTFRDERSGLDPMTIVDGINYEFLRDPVVRNRVTIVTSLTASPAGANPTAARTVVGKVNKGRLLLHGVYKIRIRSGPDCVFNGIHDLAGNGMDGEFYGDFPSGNTLKNVNDDFVAYLRFNGRKVAPPSPTQSSASPVTPRGTPGPSSVINKRPITGRNRDALGRALGPPDFGTVAGGNGGAWSGTNAATAQAKKKASAQRVQVGTTHPNATHGNMLMQT